MPPALSTPLHSLHKGLRPLHTRRTKCNFCYCPICQNFRFARFFQKSSNRIFSKNKSRHFVTLLVKIPIASALIFDLIGHIQFFFTSSLSINEQNKRHQLFTVDALWVTHYSLFTKLKLNKIAARWPAKAVAQFSTFSKIGSDRIVPR